MNTAMNKIMAIKLMDLYKKLDKIKELSKIDSYLGIISLYSIEANIDITINMLEDSIIENNLNNLNGSNIGD